jgi:hypothetical protein
MENLEGKAKAKKKKKEKEKEKSIKALLLQIIPRGGTMYIIPR